MKVCKECIAKNVVQYFEKKIDGGISVAERYVIERDIVRIIERGIECKKKK